MSNAGGGLPPINVRIAISTTGAAAARNAVASVGAGSQGMARSVAASTVPIRMMGDAMRQTASLIKYAVIGELVNAGKQAIQMSRQFEISMSQIRGLVGISAQQVKVYKDEILALGAASSKGPIELADALYFITSAGIKGQRALEVLKESAESAAAGLGETKIVADALTSILNAYGGSTYSAAKANDILVATVREGKAEADQFAPALGKVLPVAAAFGASFEDVSAGVAALTRGGASAGTSAIYLRQVLSQLLKPSKQAADTMRDAGTSAEELRNKIQNDGLLNALSYLNTKLGGTDAEIASAGLTKVFGNVRALTAVFSLLGPNLEANRQIFENLNNATGDADLAFQAYTKTADYKFKKAAAESQSALIRLGDAIMPTVTGLMEMGGAIARVAETMFRFAGGSNIFNKIAKGLLMAGAAAMIFTRASLFLFTRVSSLVRLFGHGQIVLRGLTVGVRGHNAAMQQSGMAAMVNSNAYKILGISSQGQIALETELAVATAGNTMITEQETIAILKNNMTKARGAAAGKIMVAASTGQTFANEAEALSWIQKAFAVESFGKSLMTALPMVIGIATLAYTLATSFGLIGGGMGAGMEGPRQSLEDINNLLETTAAYASTGINIAVTLDDKDAGKTPDELKKETIDAVDSAFYGGQDALQNAMRNSASSASKINIAAAILGGMKIDDPEARADMAQRLSDVLGMGAAESTKILDVQSKQYGANAAGLYNASVTLALAQKKKNTWAPDIQPDFAAIDKFSGLYGNELVDALRKEGISADYFEQVGRQISAQFNRTGDVAGFFKSFGYAADQLKGFTKEEQELAANDELIVKSFEELNAAAGDTGVKFENLKDGLANIVSSADNTDALTAFLGPLNLGTQETAQLVEKLQTELGKLKNATPAEQMRVFSEIVLENSQVVANNEHELRMLQNSAYDVTTEFENGLNPAIQDQVDAFDAATEAIKNYEKGQEAVAGLSKNFVEAQIDANNATNDFKESLKDAGGTVGFSGKQGKAYEDLIKFTEESLNVANIIMASDDPQAVQKATEYMSKQYTQAIAALTANGKTSVEDAQQQLANIGFNPMDIARTWTGNKTDPLAVLGLPTAEAMPETTKAIVEGFRAGLLGNKEGDKTGVTEFNKQLLQDFYDDWRIASPSKVAAEKIGLPIGQGIIQGMLAAATSDESEKVTDAITRRMERDLQIGSPSKLIAKTIGKPAGQGFIKGFVDVVSAQSAFGTDGFSPVVEPLVGATESAGKTAAKRFADALKGGLTAAKITSVLKQISDKKTPFKDFLNAVVGNIQDALGTVGGYIDAQLNLSKAILETQKLAYSQQLLDGELAKSIRERERNARKFGDSGGTAVTDYEISKIEELQKAFEQASRNYSMRRGTLTDVMDAEDALNEARAAASEASSEVIDSENAVLDARNNLKNKDLEASKAIYDVVDAQQAMTDAAIQLRINMSDAVEYFNNFANQALPNLGISFANLGISINELNKASGGYGDIVTSAIPGAKAETESVSFSPVVDTPTDTSAGGGTGFGWNPATGKPFANFIAAAKALHPNFFKTYKGSTPNLAAKSAFPKLYEEYKRLNLTMLADGGLVTRPTLSMVGEAGPELVIPLSKLNTTTALERYTNVKPSMSDSKASNNQVFNITVNNPVPETASDSISRRMKSLSNAGLFG